MLLLIGSWLCVKEFKCDKISLKTADVKILFIFFNRIFDQSESLREREKEGET